MLEKIRIGKASLSDFEEIDKFDIFAGDRKAEIQREECYVATHEKIITEYVTFDYSFYGRPFIRFLCIRPDFKRKGIGNKIMEFVEQICEGKIIFSSTESDNLAMIKLFEKREYKISGVIENLQIQTEIVYCKDLTSSSP
jgi:GNAT superfamily N-acetyltransferase